MKFPEGSFIKYNSGNSTLLFHGTPKDLSMLEELVASKTAEQPLQVVVSATFLEVNQTDLEELGFNWIVNLNLDPSKWFMGGAGTNKNDYNNTVLDSAASVVGAAVPAGVVGGLRSGNQVFTEDSIDGMIERGFLRQKHRRGLRSRRCAQHRHHARHVEPGGHHDDHARPEPEERHGHHAASFRDCAPRGKSHLLQRQGTDLPHGIRSARSSQQHGNNNNGDDWGDYDDDGGDRLPVMPITPAHPSAYETRQLGTVFNVEVTGISDDKSIVEMTVVPEIVDFDGFINYGTPLFVPVASQEKNAKEDIVMVKASDNFILQPVFSTRRLTAPVRIATGSTLVIGALKKSTSITYEDKIPILGDIPWVGRLFRSKGSKEERKAIIIMVKAEVVDPGGKQLYTPAPPFRMRKLRQARASSRPQQCPVTFNRIKTIEEQ